MKTPLRSATDDLLNSFANYESTPSQQPNNESLSSGDELLNTTVGQVRSQVNEMVNFSLQRTATGKDKGRFVDETIGHVLNTVAHMSVYTTPEAIFKNTPREKLFSELQAAVKDVPFEHKGVLVRLGHVPLWDELKRLYQRGIEHRPNIIMRTLVGIPTVVGGYLAGKLARSDFYNPFTRTAVVYHPDKAVGMYQLGAAYFYDQKKYPSVWAMFGWLPGLEHYKEYQKSNAAMKMEPDPAARAKIAEVLQPMYSRTVSQYVPLSFAPIVGAWLTKFFTRSNKSNIFLGKDEKTFSEELASEKVESKKSAQ
jgi:hypothetical protein